MSKLKIFMESGHTIEVECEEWQFTRDVQIGKYAGYSFTGLKNVKSIGLVANKIVGYIELEDDLV